MSDIENFLGRGLDRMGLELDRRPEALSRLARYFQELKKWNSKVNLVARSLDDKEILEKHFLDSLALLALLPAASQRQENLLDVGTGAGFPGLVLKAACPALPVTLIEPRKNRFYFLKHIIRILALPAATVLQVRLTEEKMVAQLADQPFSMITSRAFTAAGRFVELASPYLQPAGRIVLMKGPGAVRELEALAGSGLLQRFIVAETRRFSLPFSGGERWLVCIRRSGAAGQQPAAG